LSFNRVELVHPAAGQIYGCAGCCGASERTFVSRFEAPFHYYDIFSEDHVFHVMVSRKAADKKPNKVVSEGCFSVYSRAGNFQRDGFGVVGENQILVGS